MKTSSRIAALAAGLALTAVGAAVPLVAHADGENMSVSVSSAQLMPHQPFTVTVSGCTDPSNEIVAVLYDGDKTLDRQTSSASANKTFEFTALQSGSLTVEATCMIYGQGSPSASKPISVSQDRIQFDPTTWKAGQAVTLTAYGFAPGEAVSLRMVDTSSNKEVWRTGVGSADGSGRFSGPVTIKPDVPLGSYVIYLEGGSRSVAGYFYWGQPDDKDDKKEPGGKAKTPTAPKKTTKSMSKSGKPGLPKTGD